MAKVRRTIDTHAEDDAMLAQFQEDVRHLAGLVIEMMDENPSTLLSPVIRRLAIDHARKVKGQQSKLAGRSLLIDNPGDKPIGSGDGE